jgi:hypothetical protein
VTLAYLDAGSGSIIASALVGGVAAAGVAARQARAKLGGIGRRKKADEQATPDTDEQAAPDDAGSDAGTGTATGPAAVGSDG